MGWFEERFENKNNRLHFACISCGKDMWFPACKHGKYLTCSEQCRERVREGKKESRARSCATCGKTFHPRQAQLRNGHGVYCSQACNKKAHEAMNSKEAQVLAKNRWKETYERRPFVLVGPKNPMWNGGKEAAYERHKLYVSEYKKNNKHKVRIWAINRRNKTGKVSQSIVAKLLKLQRGMCAICRCNIKSGFHVDHIEPLAKGGANDDANLQLLCPPCNLNKAAKDPIAHMQSKGFLL